MPGGAGGQHGLTKGLPIGHDDVRDDAAVAVGVGDVQRDGLIVDEAAAEIACFAAVVLPRLRTVDAQDAHADGLAGRVATRKRIAVWHFEDVHASDYFLSRGGRGRLLRTGSGVEVVCSSLKDVRGGGGGRVRGKAATHGEESVEQRCVDDDGWELRGGM